MHLKISDGFGEQTSRDEIEEACGDDQEDLQSELVSSLVDDEADDNASEKSANYCEWERCRW